MVSTLSGYTGGTTDEPSYYMIGDHSEAVQVIYDPAQISYERLLEVFWQLHNPGSRSYSNQYRNAIFTLDEDQKRIAEASRQALEQKLGQPINTAIEKAGIFTPAEDYHQKYYLKGTKPLMDLLNERYPDRQKLFRSTEAARLNGYFRCNGEPDQLGEELRQFNLPAKLESDLFDSLISSCRNFHDSGCALPLRH